MRFTKVLGRVLSCLHCCTNTQLSDAHEGVPGKQELVGASLYFNHSFEKENLQHYFITMKQTLTKTNLAYLLLGALPKLPCWSPFASCFVELFSYYFQLGNLLHHCIHIPVKVCWIKQSVWLFVFIRLTSPSTKEPKLESVSFWLQTFFQPHSEQTGINFQRVNGFWRRGYFTSQHAVL